MESLEKKYNYEEIYELIRDFVDYNKECQYDIPDLFYYLKYKMGIDCLDDWNKIGEDYLEDSDDIYTNNLKLSNEEEKKYYEFLFSEISDNQKEVLNELEKVINKYLKTGIIPDPYIESQKKKTLLLRKKND